MGKSMSEAVAASPPMETADQKRVRELAALPVLTNPQMQEAIQLLLKKEAATISQRRKPRP